MPGPGHHPHGPHPGGHGPGGSPPGAAPDNGATPPPMPPEPDFEFLQPEQVRLFEDGTGWLRLEIPDDRTYLGVKAVRAFPHSEPDRYLVFLNARGQDAVIGIIVEPDRLEPETKALADKALEHHYFIPTITSVNSMKEEFGAVYFDVETDRGPRQFVGRGVRDGMENLPNGHILLPDVDGNRYRIRDWRTLDPKSRGLLERIV